MNRQDNIFYADSNFIILGEEHHSHILISNHHALPKYKDVIKSLMEKYGLYNEGSSNISPHVTNFINGIGANIRNVKISTWEPTHTLTNVTIGGFEAIELFAGSFEESYDQNVYEGISEIVNKENFSKYSCVEAIKLKYASGKYVLGTYGSSIDKVMSLANDVKLTTLGNKSFNESNYKQFWEYGMTVTFNEDSRHETNKLFLKQIEMNSARGKNLYSLCYKKGGVFIVGNDHITTPYLKIYGFRI